MPVLTNVDTGITIHMGHVEMARCGTCGYVACAFLSVHVGYHASGIWPHMGGKGR